MKPLSPLRTPLPLLCIFACTTLSNAAPTLIKLADFDNRTGNSPQAVNDSPILLNNKLWMLCEKGGNGFGALSTYDLSTGNVSVVLGLDNDTGHTPKASPVADGDLLYITTIGSTSGSIYSTLFSYNMADNTYQPRLWESVSNSSPDARSPWGAVSIIDRGVEGKDLYFNTYSGGSPSTGTIQRYNTNSGQTQQIHAFTGNPDGRAPYKGFTTVGTDLYFTTFNGGTGLGTLGKLDVSVRGAETVTTLAAMPTVEDSYAQLPSHNPYYRKADHCLYFTTVGSNTQPGALMKYDINAGQLTFLHKIQGAATNAGPFPEGNKCYGPVAEWNKVLYYTTIGGGNNATGTGLGGTINAYHLETGVHETLYHLDAGTNDGFGGEARGGFVFNESATDPAFFLITKQGGLYDHGTILKLTLDPKLPDSTYKNWLAQYPELTPAQSTLNADPDGDGRSNRSEFAFGTSPLSGSDGNGHSSNLTENGLELRWTARTDSSVTYVVTGNQTLGQNGEPWTPVNVTPEILSQPDITVPDGYHRRRVVIPLTETSGFFRVEATLGSAATP